MSPMCPMGQMASNSSWAGHKTFMLPGPPRAQIEIHKESAHPGLNHKPWVVLYAEFKFGIRIGWNVDEIIKKSKFRKIKNFILDSDMTMMMMIKINGPSMDPSPTPYEHAG